MLSRLPFLKTLWALIAVGTLIRLLLATQTNGVPFDLESFGIAAGALKEHGLDAYSFANAGQFPRWPYPPGFLPWAIAADGLAGMTPISAFTLYRLPPILADAAIAWLVQDFLRGRGAGESTRLAAVALVALGPSFGAISGHHGQIDSLAILPAVAALTVWERADPRTRALSAGLLIGAGGAIKTVPLFMALALLPSSRSVREGITLAVSAAAVPVALMVPFLLADPEGSSIVFRYRGAVGLGGISLLAQPELAKNWFGLGADPQSGLSSALRDHGGVVTLGGVLLTSAYLIYRRTPAPLAAAVLWLAVYVSGVTFFLQYMVWGIPFFLMAGYVRECAILQGMLLVPTLVTYIGPSMAWQVWLLYVIPMIAVWGALAVAYLVSIRGAPGPRAARA